MKNNFVSFILSMMCFSNVSQANSLAWVASISTGPIWAIDPGENQTIFLAPQTEKTYTADDVTDVMAEGEFFLGLQKSLNNRLIGQLGLTYVITGDATLSGDIWDDADPQFNNHAYNYKISHSHVALKGKLLADWGYWLMPWISASAGVGFNDAHDFTNKATIFQALPDPDFSSNTQTAFTYTLGIGLQTSFDEHWQMGLGYEFADWGKSELGQAPGQTTNETPSLDHLYTNGMLLNITYIW